MTLLEEHNRNAPGPQRLSLGNETTSLKIVRDNNVSDEDLNKPFKESAKTPFTARIINFAGPEFKIPANIKLYDGTGDSEDHLNRFIGAANSGN